MRRRTSKVLMFCGLLALIIASTLFFGKEEVFSQRSRRYDDQYRVRTVISPSMGEDKEIARANRNAIEEILNDDARSNSHLVSMTSVKNIIYIVTRSSR